MESIFNAEMLNAARESRGLTQVELAERLGVNQATVSGWESALSVPAQTYVEGIALILDYPVDLFFLHRPVRSVEDAYIYHRNRKIPARLLSKIVQRSYFEHLRLESLTKNLVVKADAKRVFREELIGADPGVAARTVRKVWNLPPGPVFNLTREVEQSGVIVLIRDFETNLEDGFARRAIPPAPNLIYMNGAMPGDRYRFTLGHELGHLVLHREPSPDQEDQSHDFSSELLMPESDITTELSAKLDLDYLVLLKRKWKVSVKALIFRARRLRIITEPQSKRLFSYYNKLKWGRGEPVAIPLEKPALLRRLLARRAEEIGFDVEQLAKEMLMNEREMIATYGNDLPAELSPSYLRQTLSVLDSELPESAESRSS